MNCPGCGAPTTQQSLEDGECGYCHAALPRPDRPAPPQVLNVTRIEVHAPDVGGVAQVAGGVFDSISGRLFGCLSGCVSLGMTIGITGLILAFVGYQLWVTTKSLPTGPAPVPSHVPAPGGKGGKRH